MNASDIFSASQATHGDQPARAHNKAALVAYFEEGSVADPREVGIELEHFLVDGTGEPLSYSQPHGVRDVLTTLSKRYPDVTVHDGDLLGVAKPSMNVTIEPAAQLELSAGPFASLDTARRIFDEFEADVADALRPVCGRALAMGYDPSGSTIEQGAHPQSTLRLHERISLGHIAVGPAHDARQRLHAGVDRLPRRGRLRDEDARGVGALLPCSR